MTNKRVYTTAEAAQYLGISTSTLRQGRMNGARTNRLKVPPHIKAGRKVLYLHDDLEAWIHQHKVPVAGVI